MVDAATDHFIRGNGCRPGAGEDRRRAIHLHAVLIDGLSQYPRVSSPVRRRGNLSPDQLRL